MLWIKGESEKCEIYANPESVNGSRDQPGFSLTPTEPVLFLSVWAKYILGDTKGSLKPWRRDILPEVNFLQSDL